MKRRTAPDPGQLGFDLLLAETDRLNQAAILDRAIGHLPSSLNEALPYCRDLIARHHAAMLAGDGKTAIALREEAGHLAQRLNHGEPGILAGPDAPGCLLADLTAAEPGTVPAWGQQGEFVLEVAGMRVLIKMSGLFGIGARFMPYLSFSAHALDWDQPFLSETGYRSFMGVNAALVPGLTPDAFAREVITQHVAFALNSKRVPILPQHRPTAARKAVPPASNSAARYSYPLLTACTCLAFRGSFPEPLPYASRIRLWKRSNPKCQAGRQVRRRPTSDFPHVGSRPISDIQAGRCRRPELALS